MLPKYSKKITKIVRDNDLRGSIVSLVDDRVNNISIITSLKKTIRSNHFHKKDWHYMYVLEGRMEYFFKKNNSNYFINLKKGDLVFTPPNEIHATYFPIKTILIVASKNARDKKTYEKDTTRVEFIDINNVRSIKRNAKKIK